MKTFVLTFFTGLALAFSASAIEPSTFDILPGTLHKGGVLSAHAVAQGTPDSIIIAMAYEITKRDLLPVPSQYLRGTYEQKLPSQFLEERGYLDLEKVKSIHIDEATVTHQGRTRIRGLNDAHMIQILPDNHKSEMFLIYHPSIKGLGWDQLKLILHTNLPLLGDYILEGKLRQP